jgi:four helix bundle protein
MTRHFAPNDETRMTKPERMTKRKQAGRDVALTWSIREEPAGAKRVFDLEERTARFGKAVIDLLKKVPRSPLTSRLIEQLVGCSSSIGANYCEADDAGSKKEFRVRISTCRKESRESKHFLRLIARAHPVVEDEARVLWREARELNLIFASIIHKLET